MFLFKWIPEEIRDPVIYTLDLDKSGHEKDSSLDEGEYADISIEHSKREHLCDIKNKFENQPVKPKA